MIDKEENLIILNVRKAEQKAEGQTYTDDYFAITRENLEFKVLKKAL